MIRGFIVGCPRSGTTLIQTQLALHPGVSTFPETQLFPQLVGMRMARAGLRTLLPTSVVIGDAIRELMLLVGFGRRLPSSFEDQLRKIGDHINSPEFSKCSFPKTKRLRELVAYGIGLFDEIAVREKTEGWIEKSPTHLRYLDVIQKYVKGCKVIHVVRDGRATVASIWDAVEKDYPYWRKNFPSIDACVKVWNSDMERIERCAKRNGHLVLNYHRFSESPAEYRKKAWEFLGLDSREDNLEQPTSVIMPYEEWKSSVGKPLHDYGLEKYEAMFSNEVRQRLESKLLRGGAVDSFN